MADTEKDDPDLELVSALKLIMSDVDDNRRAMVINRAFTIHSLDETGEQLTLSDLSLAIAYLEDAMRALDPSSVYGNYPMGYIPGSGVFDKLKGARESMYHARDMLYTRLRRTLP